MNPLPLKLFVCASVLLIAGCASLPDPRRIEAVSDAMTYYSSILGCSAPPMANNMARISGAAERAQRKAERDLDAVSKSTYKVESSVKAHLDTKREGAETVKAIHRELRGVKESLGGRPTPAETQGETRLRNKINERLQQLEGQVESLSKRIERTPAAR